MTAVTTCHDKFSVRSETLDTHTGRGSAPVGENMYSMGFAGRDLGKRLGLTLAAALACLVAAAPASAAPAPTQLTISGPKKAVSAGGKATLTATLTSTGKPLAGKSVAFLSGTTEVGTAKTDSKGNAEKAVKLTAPASFLARYTPVGADVAATRAARAVPSTSHRGARLSVSIGSYLHAGRKPVGVPGSNVRIRGQARAQFAREPGSRSRCSGQRPVRVNPHVTAYAIAEREVRALLQAQEPRRLPRERAPGRRRRGRPSARGSTWCGRARTTARAASACGRSSGASRTSAT